MNESSIGPWLNGLRKGEAESLREIWKRYYDELARVADRRLASRRAQVVDGEDVAASVMESLWRGMQAGRFAEVQSRDQLWWTLLRMTKRKCIDQIRKQNAERRGGRAQTISIDQQFRSCEDLYKFLVSETPDAEYFAILEEEYHRLLGTLTDHTKQKIAVYRIEGYSIDEIGKKLGISVSSVTRKLAIIRSVWEGADFNGTQLGPKSTAD